MSTIVQSVKSMASEKSPLLYSIEPVDDSDDNDLNIKNLSPRRRSSTDSYTSEKNVQDHVSNALKAIALAVFLPLGMILWTFTIGGLMVASLCVGVFTNEWLLVALAATLIGSAGVGIAVGAYVLVHGWEGAPPASIRWPLAVLWFFGSLGWIASKTFGPVLMYVW